MASTAKKRQISVRVSTEIDDWLKRRVGGDRNKAAFIRRLIERERQRERERELQRVFDAAAEDLTQEDIEERESLLGGFSGTRD